MQPEQLLETISSAQQCSTFREHPLQVTSQTLFPLLGIWAITRYLSWSRGCSRTCTSWSGCMFSLHWKKILHQRNIKCSMHSILGYFTLCKYQFAKRRDVQFVINNSNWLNKVLLSFSCIIFFLLHVGDTSRISQCMPSLLKQYCENKTETISCVFCCRILEHNNIHQISSMTFSGLNSLVLLWVFI